MLYLSLEKAFKLHLLIVIGFINETYGSGTQFWTLSSCDQDTDWTKGSGQVIKSWLTSVQPTYDNFTVTKLKMVSHILPEQHSIATVKPVLLMVDAVPGSLTWRMNGNQHSDGWIYGHSQAGAKMTGHNIAFIYPDFKNVILGRFRNGELISGHHTTINYHRCRGGIMELKFLKITPEAQQLTYTLELPVLKDVKVLDPYDKYYVFVAPSKIESKFADVGDGLFAKRNLLIGAVICYYHGFFEPRQSRIFHPNMTAEEMEARHKNLINFNKTHVIDLPRPYDSLINYRATLGHKANHSFKPNAKYHYCKHPRFGPSRCLIALSNIAKGAEILVDYSYNPKGARVPRWYKRLYAETYPESKNKKKKQ